MGSLQDIPGVGKNKGFQEDKCQLYVFRLAAYCAENETHEAKMAVLER